MNEVQSITVSDRITGLLETPVVEGNYSVYDYFTADTYDLSGATLFTGTGTVSLQPGQSLSVYTATGVYGGSNETKLLTGLKATNGGSYTTFSPLDTTTGLITAQTVHDDTVITTVLKPVTKTYTAASSGNFIFAGKGWGHGVGLCQYGACDLAKAGAKAETILELYYPGSKIVDRTTVGW